MKKIVLLFAVYLAAVAVSAEDPQPPSQPPQTPSQPPQYRVPPYRVPRAANADLFRDKRFQALRADGELFWMDSTNGELWRFDPTEPGWDFLGEPRGASAQPNGTYLLQSRKPGELLLLDTTSGKAWWIRGGTWIRFDKPSSRRRNDDDATPRSWDELWEQFKNP